MNVITLENLYRTARKAKWHGLHQVREQFPSADQVGSVLIFDVLGGNYRLIMTVNYGRQIMFVSASDAPGVRSEGVDAMGLTTTVMDDKKYANLLSKALPKVIETDKSSTV